MKHEQNKQLDKNLHNVHSKSLNIKEARPAKVPALMDL